ncbi:membrane metallo-endopeptidase-like 1 [Teleopsis dalmanni]|uniref:membrane metallo-endopeptidase-like 1 n=1 Tax=Teleopsis dalmanni TaxID=139649 RepID=UPI0018CCB26C|nr:membrane metallo-endopeptidase-like 1 [Teleopsis dalmanni]
MQLCQNKRFELCYMLLVSVLLIQLKTILTAADVHNDTYFQKVMANLNTTVNPCEDFYEYACGNWISHYLSEEYLDMPGYMDYKTNEQLIEILLANSNKTGIYEQIWNYYQSCVQLKDPVLNYYLKKVQKELNFEWPIFRKDWHKSWANETDFDWLHTIAALRSYGLNGIFLSNNVNVQLKNGSHYLMEIHQHQSKYVLQKENVAEIFQNFGMTKDESNNITERVMLLEEQMKNLTVLDYVNGSHEEINYENIFKEFSIKELIEEAPNIDWQKYFETVLGRTVNVNKEIVQTFTLNFDYIDNLLGTLNSTTNETIAYYIMLKFMYQIEPELPLVTNRSIRCIRHLRGMMPLGMNYLYEEYLYKNKRESTDAALSEIFEKLRYNFELIVNENYLGLNEEEKNYVLRKLRNIKLKIGNIPKDMSLEFVQQYYKNIQNNISDFYGNHLQLLKFNTRQQQEKLKNVVTPDGKVFYLLDIGTAVSSSPVKIFDNIVLVPYGYLQLPFFKHDLSDIYKYSLFGFILAHEIMHTFDLFQIVYDEHSNYNSMGVAVAQHYAQHINCLPRSTLDILSENIADVAGIRLAYRTYFDDVVNDSQLDNQFATNNFTSQQLFFINSVQLLCANINKISSFDIKSLHLEHDMDDVRARRNWPNFEQFAVAFGCANDTNLHPANVCRLW